MPNHEYPNMFSSSIAASSVSSSTDVVNSAASSSSMSASSAASSHSSSLETISPEASAKLLLDELFKVVPHRMERMSNVKVWLEHYKSKFLPALMNDITSRIALTKKEGKALASLLKHFPNQSKLNVSELLFQLLTDILTNITKNLGKTSESIETLLSLTCILSHQLNDAGKQTLHTLLSEASPHLTHLWTLLFRLPLSPEDIRNIRHTLNPQSFDGTEREYYQLWGYAIFSSGSTETINALWGGIMLNHIMPDAAVRHGQLDILVRYLSWLPDESITPGYLGGLLLMAAEAGHLSIVEYCMGQSANDKLESRDAETALQIASKNGHLDVVKYLIENTSEIIPAEVSFSLDNAVLNGHSAVVEYLITITAAKPAITLENNRLTGRNLLHSAVKSGDLATVQHIVEFFANPEAIDLPNDNGETALHLAAYAKHVHIVQFLLSQGADPYVGTNRTDHSDCLMAAGIALIRDIPQDVATWTGCLQTIQTYLGQGNVCLDGYGLLLNVLINPLAPHPRKFIEQKKDPNKPESEDHDGDETQPARVLPCHISPNGTDNLELALVSTGNVRASAIATLTTLDEPQLTAFSKSLLRLADHLSDSDPRKAALREVSKQLSTAGPAQSMSAQAPDQIAEPVSPRPSQLACVHFAAPSTRAASSTDVTPLKAFENN